MGQQVEIKFIDDRLAEEYGAPEYGTAGSAAVDLRACGIDETAYIQPGCSAVFSAGFAMHIGDPSLGAIIIPRSGLGFKFRLGLNNSTGLIDSDYQGEIRIALENRGRIQVKIAPYDRVCQMIFIPIVRVQWEEVAHFTGSSGRGTGGIGSTGVS